MVIIMEKIYEFVDSFIPKNLPSKRKQMLRDELSDHIFEKTAFYEEIGYTKEQSIEKATEEFGRDEEMKKHIFNEFEQLYAEKNILGIIAFIVIVFMNFMCFPLDIWVTSVDFNKDPDLFGTAVSFTMIFVVLSMIVFARIKKYRKMLLAIGITNILIAVSTLFNIYPQMAAYTVGYNFIYLFDTYTPFLLENLFSDLSDIFIIAFWWYGTLLIPAVYCIVTSVLLKKGKAKTVKQPVKKVSVFCAVYLCIAAVSCMLLPSGQNYVENYPVWFSPHSLCIVETPDAIFSEIHTGMSTESANEVLNSYGYQTLDDYRETLDRVTKKQFDAALKKFDFIDGYTVWFSPDKYVSGGGFVGVKSENGTVMGVGIGNLNKKM